MYIIAYGAKNIKTKYVLRKIATKSIKHAV